MKIKYILALTVLLTTIMTTSTFAAGTTPDTEDSRPSAMRSDENRGRGQNRRNARRHKKGFKEMREAMKSFKDSEQNLIDSLKDLDQNEAGKKIEEFYTTAFNNLPERKSPVVEKVTEAVESMDIPADTRTAVIEKINEVTSVRRKSITDKAADFAESFSELPPEERDNAIRSYNRWLIRNIYSPNSSDNGMRGRHMRGNRNQQNCRGCNNPDGKRYGRMNRRRGPQHEQRDSEGGRRRGPNRDGRGYNDCASDECPMRDQEETPPPAE